MSAPLAAPPPLKPANHVVWFLVAGIVAALGACVGLGVVTLLVGRHQPDHAASVEADSTAHPGDLRSYLMPAPAGAQPWKNPPGTDEHLSLDQDAELTTDPDAVRVMLRFYHFKEGAVRTWTASDKTVVEVHLLRFEADDDAEGYYQADASDLGTRYPPLNSVDGIPEGVVAVVSQPDQNGQAHVVGMARNRNIVLVVWAWQAGEVVPGLGQELVKRQYERL